ncbi:hypothetical protein IMG5_194250 [Ichthyophthirius multifiliis]|uniref:Uncharacterized protein n=1 Tax=Ichthyophthirius multifiliis TaxID=5932 RepID=G0R4Q6_ICHMU|nr:hypothetical protein IMG5_194250 [Ichthyophthirius multifiliis]EGR27562.1 hypothetical protein IMG5_194250 [Ichthyophthirius multifiliis]|eukprot:XP_004025014.1 hypothetical protein IMG5_194250 [Ichthyophthirius multifiliis]
MTFYYQGCYYENGYSSSLLLITKQTCRGVLLILLITEKSLRLTHLLFILIQYQINTF